MFEIEGDLTLTNRRCGEICRLLAIVPPSNHSLCLLPDLDAGIQQALRQEATPG